MTTEEGLSRGRPRESLDAVAELVDGFGVGGRRLLDALAMLAGERQTLESLVRASALPRRTVESLLRAADRDLDGDVDGYVIRADRVAGYRDRFALDQLRGSRVPDPYDAQLAALRTLVAQVNADIEAAPAAREDLDHVAATAETVVRRALWLNATFSLARSHLLCIGDHDLSSLALCAVMPDLAVTVVDVDEPLLEFIEQRAAGRGHDIRCCYSDFRFGIPEVVAGSADIVLTDPPYTPEGVQLFLGRGVQGLRDRTNGRLVMAYGFSPLHPALGMKVQRAVQDLDLVIEAMLPAFNRYHGAQAVGSASDMYVLRPTARTFQILDRKLARTAVNVYTHGKQSLEGRSHTLDPAAVEAALRSADGAEDGRPPLLVGEGWPTTSDGTVLSSLASLFTSGMPASARHQGSVRVVANLLDDPGPWLLRALLAVNAQRLVILVPNNHPDLAGQDMQQALIDLVAPKYSLRLRRSTPTSDQAMVEATAVAAGQCASAVARYLLCRAHGRIGSVWREALIRYSAECMDTTLSKNEARTLIARTGTRQAWLDARLIDLPRHAVRILLAAADAAVLGGGAA